MTIQEYIRVAAKGKPRKDFLFYLPYFTDMNCKWCIYNGYACKHPKGEGVCIDYRVEKLDLELRKA